jgi:hypothetical protein
VAWRRFIKDEAAGYKKSLGMKNILPTRAQLSKSLGEAVAGMGLRQQVVIRESYEIRG